MTRSNASGEDILGKGHAQAALSLWNNMLEPVGSKKLSWHLGEPLKCPNQDAPFIFTSKNSADAMNLGKNTTRVQTTRRASTMSTDTATAITATDAMRNTSVRHHKKHKKGKSDSVSPSNRSTYLVFTGLLFIVMFLIVVAVVKRQNIRQVVAGGRQRRFERFNNSRDPDEMDEVEVWSHPQSKPTRSDRRETTETHGTRLNFD